MVYTETVNYIEPTPLTVGESFYDFLQYKCHLNHGIKAVMHRHNSIFDHKHFNNIVPPIEAGGFNFEYDNTNLNVLRMMVKEKGSRMIHLPSELCGALKYMLKRCCGIYTSMFDDYCDSFIYITVRTCDGENYYKNSSTWHIDGFQGSRIARHKPEINFIWANNHPTEFAIEPYDVADFDYTKYNINSYFKDYTKGDQVFTCKPERIYMIDPYMVHRAPACDFDSKRIIVRINFSPVEIEDYTNTVNPMLPKHYEKRTDVRDTLTDFRK